MTSLLKSPQFLSNILIITVTILDFRKLIQNRRHYAIFFECCNWAFDIRATEKKENHWFQINSNVSRVKILGLISNSLPASREVSHCEHTTLLCSTRQQVQCLTGLVLTRQINTNTIAKKAEDD